MQFLITILALLPAATFACSCVSFVGTLEDGLRADYDRATLVFVGTALKETADPDDLYLRETEFSTQQVLKGGPKDRVTISIWVGCCACGIDFEVGSMYLVFARAHDELEGVYTTSTCTHTTYMDEAGIARFQRLLEVIE